MAASYATLSFPVPPEIKERLEKLADATGRSQATLAMEDLYGYLDEQEWQVAEIKAAVEEADRTDPADFIPHDEVMRKIREQARSK